MRGEVEVQSVGEGIHESLEPGRAAAVLRPQGVGVDEQPHAEIGVDRRRALGFRQAAERIQVVGLDAVEVVLGLGILHPEHRVGVGLPVHVRDAPVVPDDGDALRLPLPAGAVRALRQ